MEWKEVGSIITKLNILEEGKEIEQKAADSGNNREKQYEVGYSKPPVTFQFSKDNQPDPEKQKKTKAEKRQSREFLKELTGMPYNFQDGGKMKAQLVEAYGDKVLKLKAIELVVLVQYHKAILGGDSRAAEFIMSHTYGPAKQIMEHQGKDGGPIQTQNETIITQVIIENPHNEKTDNV